MDDAVLYNLYFDACTEAGYWLLPTEIQSRSDLPPYNHIYVRKFGGLRRVRKILRELDPQKSKLLDEASGTWNESEECIIDRYYSESLKCGHWLTGMELDKNNNLPSRMGIKSCFTGVVDLRQKNNSEIRKNDSSEK